MNPFSTAATAPTRKGQVGSICPQTRRDRSIVDAPLADRSRRNRANLRSCLRGAFFRLRRRANQWLLFARPVPDQEGRFAIVTNVGCWDAMDAVALPDEQRNR